MKKIFTAIIAAAAAISTITVCASAYTINKDLGMGWTASSIIGGEEFLDMTADNTITITITGNEALADMPGQEYWCIKPMINCEGWPFMDDLAGLTLAEDGTAYSVDPTADSISFRLSAEELEQIQMYGMALMGHGITLEEMAITDEPLPAPTEAVDTKTNPDTGAESIAAILGISALASAGMIISRKRK